MECRNAISLRDEKSLAVAIWSCDFRAENCFCVFSHGVLQGAAQKGGAILIHFCGSPDPFFMEQNESLLP